ncbi:hypothetical protein WA158_002246 [Blastocystis sp. Blastoise]
MSKLELLLVAGLRGDGRKPNEIRRLACRFGVFDDCDGSFYLEMGNTKVLAVVYGPREVQMKSKEQIDKAYVECVVSVSPFSGLERKQISKNNRQTQEMALAIQRCYENVILTHLYPHSQISIHLSIISSDGSLLSACINAATLALIDAGVPMSDFLVSCTAGYIERTCLIDLNNQESRTGGVVLPVAWLPRTNSFPLVTMDSKIPLNVFEDILNSAREGCRQVYNILSNEVKENALRMIQSERRFEKDQ